MELDGFQVAFIWTALTYAITLDQDTFGSTPNN